MLGSLSVELTNVTAGPTLPSPWIVAGIVVGLPLTLWAYKCLMMYAFQRKIIYMPYAPINARKDTLSEAPKEFTRGLDVEEVHVPSRDDITLSGIYVRSSKERGGKDPKVIMLYFQGNAGNPLHRLPVFQSLHASPIPSSFTAVLAVAPRGYWSSPGRPSQHGIIDDYLSVLHYALERWPNAKIVVYGHSLGGAAGVCLLSQLQDPLPAEMSVVSTATSSNPSETFPSSSNLLIDYARIRGLILENPFSSIPGMVRALYPQKWLPYHYIAPLAWDKWDALGALRALNDMTSLNPPATAAPSSPPLSSMSSLLPCSSSTTPSSPSLTAGNNSVLRRLAPDILLLLSEHDEIVPREMGEAIWEAMHSEHNGRSSLRSHFTDKDMTYGDDEHRHVKTMGKGKKVVIPHALHETAWQRMEWSKAVREYLGNAERES